MNESSEWRSCRGIGNIEDEVLGHQGKTGSNRDVQMSGVFEETALTHGRQEAGFEIGTDH